MPNTAPGFEDALVTLALFEGLRQSRQLHSVNLKAGKEFLNIVTNEMEKNPLLTELMEKMPKQDKLELGEVFTAGTTPTKPIIGDPTPTIPKQERKPTIAQQHFAK
ncbi:MAG: hypothetical protein PHD48_03410 [Alphaproteobacteria bacterium]|nr:hypothetical protein [Alphaproteobacteria bacterium]